MPAYHAVTKRYLLGNIFADDAPPHHFKGFLVGALAKWSDDKPPEARAVATRYSLLDVSNGPLSDCEVKVSREHSHKTGPEKPDRNEPPFQVTVGVILFGCMRITLTDRGNREVIEARLESGDFLAWPGSAYTHVWQCESEATVVTLRWREMT